MSGEEASCSLPPATAAGAAAAAAASSDESAVNAFPVPSLARSKSARMVAASAPLDKGGKELSESERDVLASAPIDANSLGIDAEKLTKPYGKDLSSDDVRTLTVAARPGGIDLSVVKTGVFSKERNVFRGSEVVSWLGGNLHVDRASAVALAQRAIDNGALQPVHDRKAQAFSDSKDALYRFKGELAHVRDKRLCDFEARDIGGNAVPLSKYQGQVVLVVNVASK